MRSTKQLTQFINYVNVEYYTYSWIYMYVCECVFGSHCWLPLHWRHKIQLACEWYFSVFFLFPAFFLFSLSSACARLSLPLSLTLADKKYISLLFRIKSTKSVGLECNTKKWQSDSSLVPQKSIESLLFFSCLYAYLQNYTKLQG